MAVAIESLETRLLWSADLSGSFSGHLPGALSPFTLNHVLVRINNAGDQPASGRVNVNLFASPSLTPGGEQALLATTARMIHLRAGQSLNVPLRFNSPSGLPNGSYYLLAQIGNDASSTVASPQTISIRQPFIDLAGQFSSFPVGAVDVNNSGNDVLGARVSNQGNVPAVGALAVSFYASADATPDASDTLIGVAARNVRIRPGGSQEFFAPITFPAGMSVGNYYVFAQVDSARAFAESNEDNNTVIGPRQLIAADVPVPTVVDRRERHHHHHDEAVIVESGGFVGGAFFVGDVADEGDFAGDPFVPDSAPPPDSGGMDQPPADSSPPADLSPPPDSAPSDGSDGWDTGSSAGSDF